MTAEQFAREKGLWAQVVTAIRGGAPAQQESLLRSLANLPVQSSRATRILGAYVVRNGQPAAIRLQFSQEPANLVETFLHELAHVCDHLCRAPGDSYRKAHGPGWRAWAARLGARPERVGESEALAQLHRQRQKLVAVCQRCGMEFRRVRRLNQRRAYQHRHCGGNLKVL